MTIRLYNIAAAISGDLAAFPLSARQTETLAAEAAQTLGLKPADILALRVVRRAIDARHTPRFVFTLDIDLGEREREMLENLPLHAARVLAEETEPEPQPGPGPLPARPVVVGAGPAGLFAAFTLARSGYRPLVIERGKPVPDRLADIAAFHAQKSLDPESNYLFGEGGAGAFSDGKLATRIDDPRIATVLAALVECGAPPEIAIDAKPHVGTDRLRAVLVNLREKIESLGGEFRFNTRLDAITPRGDALELQCSGEKIPAGILVLAIGHSARDTYAMLRDSGVALERRAFQMGLRIEHPRELIDRAQYGNWFKLPALGAADYRIVWKGAPGPRPVYSFCMCPGGQLMAATAQPDCLCTNGMSNHARDGKFSNSALVSPVTPGDFASFAPQGDPLAGLRFQEHWERAAFTLAGGEYRAPAQTAPDFIAGSVPATLPETSYAFGLAPADLSAILPPFIIQAIRKALPVFAGSINGFDGPDALLIGPETRVSSPVRITRDDDTRVSLSTPNLYPVGEGAGYASGIMSSALDAILTAHSIISRFSRP